MCYHAFFFPLGFIKADKAERRNQEHSTVILIYNLLHILQQIFHEKGGQFRSCRSSAVAASQVGEVWGD